MKCNNKNGVIHLIAAATWAVVGIAGWFGFQDHKTLNEKVVPTMAQHEERLTGCEETGVRHEKALNWLYKEGKYSKPSKPVQVGPEATWMRDL